MDFSPEDSPRVAQSPVRAFFSALVIELAFALPVLAGPMISSRPVQPGPIDFGSGPVGVTNLHTFSTSNPGDADLLLFNPLLSGTDASSFSLFTAFPLSMQVGSRPVDIDLGCIPGRVGLHTATLSFNTNDPSFPQVSYRLVCTGSPGNVAPGFGSTPAAPGPIQFGSGPVGTTNEQVVFVEEEGTASLQVSSPLLGGNNPGDFSVTSTFPFTIDDGDARRAVTVTCTPTALGPRLATLTLQSNDPTTPSVVFNLVCEGASGGVTPGYSSQPTAPGPLVFDVVSTGVSVGRMVLIEERGSGTLTLHSPLLWGPGASQFGIATPFPLNVVDGSWGATVTIHCVPPASDSESAVLTLQTNDPATPSVDFRLECGTDIFADDFESGGMLQWSVVVP